MAEKTVTGLSVGFRPLPDSTPWMPEMRNGNERAWWTDVEPDEEEADFAWFRDTVYGGMWGYLPLGGIPRRRVSAFERWREEPSDRERPAPLAAYAPPGYAPEYG